MAEGASLLRTYAGDRIEGSNPSLSVLFLESSSNFFCPQIVKICNVTANYTGELQLVPYFVGIGGGFPASFFGTRTAMR